MKIKINILTFFQEANRKKTNNKAMKKNKDRKQNYNISITDNRILDYFKIYDAYKNGDKKSSYAHIFGNHELCHRFVAAVDILRHHARFDICAYDYDKKGDANF